MTDAPLDEAGNRPVSLAITALRWDLAAQLLDHGHTAKTEGMPSLWRCAFEGLLAARRRATGEPARSLEWRFQKTLDLLLDRQVPADAGMGEASALDTVLAAGFDRIAQRMLACGVAPTAGERPSFEYALGGSALTTVFRLLQSPDQANRLAQATAAELAYWLDIIARRRNTDLLEVFLAQLTPDREAGLQRDLAGACVRQGWSVQLGRMVLAGKDLSGPLADGRHLAHEAARHADEDMLLFLRTHRLDFDLGPDPWTGLTPAQTLAQRFPNLQVLPATVLPLRRRRAS